MTLKLCRPFFFFSSVISVCLFSFSIQAARQPSHLKPIKPQPQVSQDQEAEIPGLPGAPTPKKSRQPASTKSQEVTPSTLTITRVVGEAAENIITSREVQINDMLEQAAFGRLPGQTQIRALRGSEKNFPIEVQTVLREWVIYIEAKSFDSSDVSQADLARTLKTAQENLSSIPAWKSLDATSAEISEILERKLAAKKFLRLKTDSAQVPITDNEALAYYKKNRLKFGELPFSSFRENIKTFLIKQQMDRRLAEWLEVLERKYKVRNFIAG